MNDVTRSERNSSLDLFFKAILAIFLLGITGSIFLQIIFRYVLARPLVWSEELSLTLMVWITFVGSAPLLLKGQHIAITFLTDLCGPATRKRIAVLSELLILAFNIILTYGSFLVVAAVAPSITPGMHISMAFQYGGILAGTALAVLAGVWRLQKLASGGNP